MAKTNPILPRKTPRQSRASFTVDMLLQAAAHILEQAGPAGFNTNAVAEKAGVSIGSLYQYFPGKQALLAALIRQNRAKLLAAIENLTAPDAAASGDLRHSLSALIAAAVQHQLQRPKLARILEYYETALPLDSETQALNRALTTALCQSLAHHGIPDAETAARDLTALARGMIDAAGLAGETMAAPLQLRVQRAVFGYLDLPQNH